MTRTLLFHGARLALWNILEALISGEVHAECPLHGAVMRSSGGDLDLWTSLLGGERLTLSGCHLVNLL